MHNFCRNEVLGLRWSNVDKDQGCFHITDQLASHEAKKVTGEMLAVLKEDYSLRTLPITNEASIYFERQYARNFISPIFSLQRSGRPLSEGHISRDQ